MEIPREHVLPRKNFVMLAPAIQRAHRGEAGLSTDDRRIFPFSHQPKDGRSNRRIEAARSPGSVPDYRQTGPLSCSSFASARARRAGNFACRAATRARRRFVSATLRASHTASRNALMSRFRTPRPVPIATIAAQAVECARLAVFCSTIATNLGSKLLLGRPAELMSHNATGRIRD